jgi:mannose-1-phosphate guanylyltransferase
MCGNFNLNTFILSGTCLYLNDVRPEVPKFIRGNADIIGNVLIDPSVKIGKGCRIGPHVTVIKNKKCLFF